MKAPDFYREEALKNAARSFVGDPVVTSPGPAITSWRRYGLLGLVAIAVLWVAVPLPDYMTAPAILDYTDSADVAATVTGRVSATLVSVGDRIRSGDQLLRLESDDLALRLRSTTGRINALLLEAETRRPQDSRELRDLASEASDLRAQMQQLVITAPMDGVVAAVRVKAGETVTTGDNLVVIAPERAQLEFIAFPTPVSGKSIGAGMAIGLIAPAMESDRISATVVSVTPTVLGPTAARHLLASQLSDVVVLPNAVVAVRTRMDDSSRRKLGGNILPGTLATAYFELGRRTLFQRMFDE